MTRPGDAAASADADEQYARGFTDGLADTAFVMHEAAGRLRSIADDLTAAATSAGEAPVVKVTRGAIAEVLAEQVVAPFVMTRRLPDEWTTRAEWIARTAVAIAGRRWER